MNHLNQLFRERIFQQIGGGACLEGAIDVLVSFVHREDDDARVRMIDANPLNRFGAAHRSQLQVHERDVGRMALVELERLLAGRHRAGDRDVGFAVQHRGDAFADDAVVIDTQHANRCRRVG